MGNNSTTSKKTKKPLLFDSKPQNTQENQNLNVSKSIDSLLKPKTLKNEEMPINNLKSAEKTTESHLTNFRESFKRVKKQVINLKKCQINTF